MTVKRETFCPCCYESVTTRDHVHYGEEALRMLRANIAARKEGAKS